MSQCTVRHTSEIAQNITPEVRHLSSLRGLPPGLRTMEARSTPTHPISHEVATAEAAPRHDVVATIVGRKTMYKICDAQTGLFCQGGSWPCEWDATGKTWPSTAALRRYLRTVLSRGYHLKPRSAPAHWQIIEVEQVTSHRERSVLPAGAL